MSAEELKEIIRLHGVWLRNEKGGRRAYMYGADMSGANMSRADMSGANMSRADMSGANMSRADMSGANMSRADMSGANMSRANMSRADMSRANMSRADMSRAKFDETIFHEGFTGTDETIVHQLLNVGSENGTLIIVNCEEGHFINRGCFRGGVKEFLDAVEERHGDNEHGRFYRGVIKIYCPREFKKWKESK